MPSTGPAKLSRRSVNSILGFALVLGAACGDDGSAPVRMTVPTGASMAVAAESLRRAGLVRAPKLFRWYARARGFDRGIKAGTYLLSPDASWESVLSSLRSGRGVVNVVTIPEGYTLAQTESLLVSRLSVPPESIRAAVRDTTLLRRLTVPTGTLEGYLFPDTYYFSPGTPPRVAVLSMIRRFEQRWKPAWTARIDTFAISRHDLITLASIVEAEAKRAHERPLIAAVYWNRLRRGMLLQADPTVQYALPQRQSRLLNRHLSVRSPYNTYRKIGLPPGPIGAPGTASIEATLFPADVSYLYFVAYPDGHHEFRATLREHQIASREARRAWDLMRAQRAPSTAPTRTGS